MDEINESIDNDVIDTQEVNDVVEETEGLETSETEESQADDDNSTESEIEELLKNDNYSLLYKYYAKLEKDCVSILSYFDEAHLLLANYDEINEIKFH